MEKVLEVVLGDMLMQVDGHVYHDFPSIESLAGDGVEVTLREMGFGYRAAYIAKTAQHIWQHHSSHYLHDLRREPYEHARSELMKLHGVGAKVTIICACFINLYDIYCSVIYTAFIINLQEYLVLPGP